MEDTLQKIITFTDQAHGQQTRKYTPDRYIVHPVRVMETCRKYTDDISVLAAALLHDVLEDTPVTTGEIRYFLSGLLNPQQVDKTTLMVEELTDVYVKKDYPGLNRRSRKSKELERLKKISPDSQTIKYADIMDNSVEIATQDTDFALVYLKESRTIMLNLTKGNEELYGETMKVIDEAINQLK